MTKKTKKKKEKLSNKDLHSLVKQLATITSQLLSLVEATEPGLKDAPEDKPRGYQ